jgi:threonine dehydratase
VLAKPPERLVRGVATHSSGNHGTALALAAGRAGVPAYVVVPETCARPKLEAIRAAGAEVTICTATKAAREAAVAEVVARTGATLVHPYDDVLVIAGQGTAAMELVEDVPGLDVLLVPVSGGGLLAGTALAARAIAPGVKVYAAEPELAADAAQTFRTKTLAGTEVHTGFTVADGLRAAMSRRTMSLMLEYVAGVLTVSEEQIVAAMRRAWAETRMIIEPSCAVPVAAVMANPALFAGQRVGIIITGGNVDLEKLPWQK